MSGKLKQENAGLKQENAGLTGEQEAHSGEQEAHAECARREPRSRPVAAPTVAKVGTMQDDDNKVSLISRPEVDDEDDDDDDDDEDYKCFSSKEEGMITSDIISSHETMEAALAACAKWTLLLVARTTPGSTGQWR